MANQNVPPAGPSPADASDPINPNLMPNGQSYGPVIPIGDPDSGDAVPEQEDEIRDPPEPVPTPEEQYQLNLAGWLNEVDNTEIVDAGSSTVAYRRSVAVFDDDDPQVQLAEHWEFRCGDYEEFGRL